jgi:hypothetical protein
MAANFAKLPERVRRNVATMLALIGAKPSSKN